jgi:outer membrane protein assembly factor BamB
LRLLEGNTKLNENPGYVRTFPKIAETDILKFYFNPNSSGEKAAPGGDLIGNLFKVTEGISGEVSIPALNVKINGLVELNDSLLKLNPVNTVVGQNPKNSDNISLIPAGCAGFVHFNIGSFSDLYNNTLVELSKDEALYRKFMENKKFVEKNLGINLRQDFAAWIGHEITVAVFTPRTYRSSAEKAIIIQTRNKLMAMDAMERVAGALSNAYPINFNTVDYRGYQIHQIELPFYLNIFLGRLFDDMPKPFYTFVDNAFIATDEKETLELLIDSFLSDKTIETDPLYSDIVPEQSPFNIMVYANLSRGQEILNDIFSNQPEENWEDLKPYLQHAKSAVFTLTRKQNRQLDFSIELKLKERTREKMVKQWRVKIPAVMPFPPQMVFTNPDEAPDIYVFTENGYIYRYDFFGSVLDETPQRKAQKFFTPPLQAEVNDESLFFISAGNKIQSFDRDLNRRMSYGSRDIISAPPLINPEKDRLYFADWSGRFYAYEISSGRLINKLELNSISRTSPLYFGDSDKITATATADGAVYFITNSGGEDKDSLTIVNTINLNEGISGNFCIVRWDRKTGLAFGTWNGIVHVIEPEMKERLTFPQKLTGRIEAGLTPVASDDQTFLVVPTTAKLIYLLDEDANTVEGWPVRTYGSIETTPGTYDFDGNGDEEILALAEDGRLYAFKINGELVRQWPIIASAMPSFYSRGTKHYMAVCDWNEKLTLWLLPRREKE